LPDSRPHIHISPTPAPGWGIVSTIKEVYAYRAMLRMLVIRSLRLRYKNSSIGVLWSLIMPLMQVLVLWVVVGFVLNTGPSNMSAYMLCAYLPWNFFQTSLLDSSSSVLTYMDIVEKVYLPRELLVFATILANAVHFVMALIVFLAYRYLITSFIFGWPGMPPTEIFLLPVVFLIEAAFVTGLSLILCAWTTFYEDVKYILMVTLNLVFYFMPVLYFAENIRYAERIPLHLRTLAYHVYLLLPMTWIVMAFKQMFFKIANIAPRGHVPIISAPFDYRLLAYSALISLVVLIAGMAYFNRMKWKFTERP